MLGSRPTCEGNNVEIQVTVGEIYADWMVFPNSDHLYVSIAKKLWNGPIDTLQYKCAPRTASINSALELVQTAVPIMNRLWIQRLFTGVASIE